MKENGFENVSPYIDVVLLALHFLVFWDYWVQASEIRNKPVLAASGMFHFHASLMNRLDPPYPLFSNFIGSLYIQRIQLSDYLESFRKKKKRKKKEHTRT